MESPPRLPAHSRRRTLWGERKLCFPGKSRQWVPGGMAVSGRCLGPLIRSYGSRTRSASHHSDVFQCLAPILPSTSNRFTHVAGGSRATTCSGRSYEIAAGLPRSSTTAGR